MKLKPLIALLVAAGNWNPLAEVLKLHPYTAAHGCLNRNEPVNAIALSRNGGNSPDLVLANAQDQIPRADSGALKTQSAQEKL